MKIKLLAGLAMGLFMFGMVGVASASSILYFTDYNVGVDRMGQALTALSGTHSVTTASSSADFATQMATGTYGLGIFSVQGYDASDYSDGITALGSFVASGGSAIYTDWSRNNTYAALFGAQWADGVNQSYVTVTDPQLAAGITNPIILSNPGWGVYSMDVTGGTSAAHFENGNGAIARFDHAIVNGFLTDTFSDGSQGVQLYINEINSLTGRTPVPEPSTMLLLGAGLAGLALYRRRR